MTGEVRFQVLGPLRAWARIDRDGDGDGDERELDLGPGKQRAVLAVLLLRVGRPVPTTQILDAVWPEDPPANGPNVVQKYVAGLRRVLEPDRSPRSPGQLLSLTGAGYLLRVDADAVDASRFERLVRRARDLRAREDLGKAAAELRAALDLWRGEPLSGLTGPYFDAVRARLVEGRATAAELWAELELALGRHQDLVAELIPLVAEFPVREPLRHALMLALHRSGRQAEALAAYREIRTVLIEEHGLEPGAELRDLHARILRDDPSLVAPAAVVAPPAPVPAPAPVSPPVPASVTEPPPAAYPPAAWPAPGGGRAALGGGPAALGGGPAAPGLRWLRNLLTVVGTLAALGSLGLLTWVVILCYGIHRHSRWLIGAAGGYAVLSATFLWVATTSTSAEYEISGFDLVGMSAVGITWLGGPLHIVVLNRGVQRLLAGGGPRVADDQRRVLREQARLLLHRDPMARTELRIGRPDLPRGHDDGGLVDVNAVPDHVLWYLPGITPEQGRQIAVDRWLRGPYTSMEDLATRCLLPPAQTEGLRDVLIFLPPPPPYATPPALPPR